MRICALTLYVERSGTKVTEVKKQTYPVPYPSSKIVFTSETKKAVSDREAPVSHIGYLRTFIHKTRVVTSVIAL